jgi:YD repeat-containing protein
MLSCNSRLADLEQGYARGSVLLEQSYARTPKGLITAITSPDPARSWTYGYDGLDRLITADNGSGITEDRSLPAPRKAARCVRGSKRSTGPFCRLRRRLSPYDAVDNLVFNSGLCAANPNLAYPPAGTPRPHAPTSICGTPVSYDANGNTTSYDIDGAGPLAPRTLLYDGENRPLAISRSGAVTSFAYGPDGSRALKVFGATTRHFFSGDELTVDLATPAGLLTANLHADIRREGLATDYLLKDHLASNRLTLRHGPALTQRHDYGKPATSSHRFKNLERAKGIEPSYAAWEAKANR